MTRYVSYHSKGQPQYPCTADFPNTFINNGDNWAEKKSNAVKLYKLSNKMQCNKVRYETSGLQPTSVCTSVGNAEAY
jgi:hypothetical protein